MKNTQNLLADDNWSPIKNLGGKFQLKKKPKSTLNEDESIDKFVLLITGNHQENQETPNNYEINSSYRTKEENETIKNTPLVSIPSIPVNLDKGLKPMQFNQKIITILADTQIKTKHIVKPGIDLVFEDYKVIKDNIYYLLMAVFNFMFPIAFTYYLMNNFDFVKNQTDPFTLMSYFVLGNILLIGVFISFIIHLLVTLLREHKKNN